MWQMSRWDEGLGQRAVLRESERPCGALLTEGSGETSTAGASQEVHLCKDKDNNQPEGGPGVAALVLRFELHGRAKWGPWGVCRGRRRCWLAELARRALEAATPHF